MKIHDCLLCDRSDRLTGRRQEKRSVQYMLMKKKTENGWRRSRSFIEHRRPGSAAGDRWLLDNRKSDKQCLA